MVNDNTAFRPRTRSGFPIDRYGPIAVKKKRLPPLHTIVARSTALIRKIAGKIVLLMKINTPIMFFKYVYLISIVTYVIYLV